jgi:UDP-3-O-[3-hydroxymyristoyl] glucosamine N-acyltransferase
MRNVVILGAGGAASELTFYIEDYNASDLNETKINIRGYIDYSDEFYKKYKFQKPLLSDIDSYVPQMDEEVLIAIMDIKFRKKMITTLIEKGAKIGSFIHHSVIRPKDLKIGVGNIVFPYSILEKHSTIGNYNFLTTYCFISHDCVVGDNNFFSVAGIAGSVKVGNNNYFGIGSKVIPQITIGNNNTVQAGMIVDKDIENETTLFYRFKEKVLAIPKK